MGTKALIDSAMDHLRASASVKTVYGEPVRVDGKTIIPVAKVAQEPGKAPPEGTGGGIAAKPIGVVEIDEGKTRFVSFGQTKRIAWATAIGSIFGLVLGSIFRGRRGR